MTGRSKKLIKIKYAVMNEDFNEGVVKYFHIICKNLRFTFLYICDRMDSALKGKIRIRGRKNDTARISSHNN